MSDGRDSELRAALPGLLTAFRSEVHDALTRIGASLGVACRDGRHGDVFTAARATRTGTLRDDRGELRYRFHGGGCHVQGDGLELEFNYHFADAKILFGTYKFCIYLHSRGLDAEEPAVQRALDDAVTHGLLGRAEPGRPYYCLG